MQQTPMPVWAHTRFDSIRTESNQIELCSRSHLYGHEPSEHLACILSDLLLLASFGLSVDAGLGTNSILSSGGPQNQLGQVAILEM